jgi:hypothetical protein
VYFPKGVMRCGAPTPTHGFCDPFRHHNGRLLCVEEPGRQCDNQTLLPIIRWHVAASSFPKPASAEFP